MQEENDRLTKENNGLKNEIENLKEFKGMQQNIWDMLSKDIRSTLCTIQEKISNEESNPNSDESSECPPQEQETKNLTSSHQEENTNEEQNSNGDEQPENKFKKTDDTAIYYSGPISDN